MNVPGDAVLFQRAALLLGRPAMDRLAESRVIVFGLGGVGSWCAESLVRTGVRRLTLVDSDLICATNVNRQSQATAANIGAAKAAELRARLLQINPRAEIAAVRVAYDETTRGQFDLAAHDYVIDAIDSLRNKLVLIDECVRARVKFYSSMGAAARLDPTQVRTATLDHTRGCALARVVRQGLRKRGVPLEAVHCVYSLEAPLEPAVLPSCGSGVCFCPASAREDRGEFPDWCAAKARVNGAVAQVTAVFGFTLASLVVRDAARG